MAAAVSDELLPDRHLEGVPARGKGQSEPAPLVMKVLTTWRSALKQGIDCGCKRRPPTKALKAIAARLRSYLD